MRRVVITGMGNNHFIKGMVSPLGNNVQKSWQRLLVKLNLKKEGQSGIIDINGDYLSPVH